MTLHRYVLSLADDVLVSAQRMGEWIAAAPQIEEDIAIGNIALDLLGQARTLLTYAGSLSDPVRSEDDLARMFFAATRAPSGPIRPRSRGSARGSGWPSRTHRSCVRPVPRTRPCNAGCRRRRW